MKLHHISRWEFIRNFPDHDFLDRIISGQVEWFADDKNSVLGALGQTRAGLWEYAVFRGNPGSGYRMQEIASGLASQSKARRRALATLGVKADADAFVTL